MTNKTKPSVEDRAMTQVKPENPLSALYDKITRLSSWPPHPCARRLKRIWRLRCKYADALLAQREK